MAIPQLKSVILHACCEPIRELQYYLSPDNAPRPLLIAFSFNHFISVCGSDSVVPNHSQNTFQCLTNPKKESFLTSSSTLQFLSKIYPYPKTTKLMQHLEAHLLSVFKKIFKKLLRVKLAFCKNP